jgi:acyl carrier protein
MESLKFVELQVAIEDEFDIELDPIHIVELNRLGDIIDYIHDCIQAKRP